MNYPAASGEECARYCGSAGPKAALLNSGVQAPNRDLMTDISTRIANPSDLHAVAVLFDEYRQFYEQPPDLLLATQFIEDRLRNNESIVILAVDQEGQSFGFCQLYPTFCSVEAAPIYSLYDLFVSPRARRAGVGKLLLLAAEEHARKNGIARMDLTTARTNVSAQSLYESLGWVRDEVYYAYSKLVAA